MRRKSPPGTMFTSAHLDEKLFMEAWSLSRHETKKEFLEEAIRIYVSLHDQAQVRSLRGKLVGNGNLDDLREGGGADPR